MNPEFWHERWQQGQIGFHLGRVNPNLERHHRVLTTNPTASPTASPRARVLVPLCGKSLDMVWLAQQGQRVVGVELSPLAVQAFWDERQLVPEIDQHGPFVRQRA